MKKRDKSMRQTMHSFDTYKYINELKEAGFKEKQAAVIIKSLVESRDTDMSHLSTKEQVAKLETSTSTQFAKIEGEISSLRNEMKAMILDTHTSTLKWMVGTMIALVGIIIAAIKLF